MIVTKISRVADVIAHPLRGLWQVVLANGDTCYLEYPYGVQAVADAFRVNGEVAAMQAKMKGESVVYSVDESGIMLGFTKVAEWTGPDLPPEGKVEKSIEQKAEEWTPGWEEVNQFRSSLEQLRDGGRMLAPLALSGWLVLKDKQQLVLEMGDWGHPVNRRIRKMANEIGWSVRLPELTPVQTELMIKLVDLRYKMIQYSDYEFGKGKSIMFGKYGTETLMMECRGMLDPDGRIGDETFEEFVLRDSVR